LHLRDVIAAEFHRLQVGETPPRLAEARLELDGAAVCGDAVDLPFGSLQYVSVGHPQFRLRRIFAGEPLVEFDGPLDLARLAECCGEQCAVGGVVGFSYQGGLEIALGCHRLAEPVLRERAGEARAGKFFDL